MIRTQQGQVTGSNGYYKFHLNFSDASCPNGGDYLIEVVPPGTGFTAGVSQVIPPLTDATTAPFSVPACPGDAIPATGQYCEIQASELAPPAAAITSYHLHLTLDDTLGAGSSQAFNNHIPLDPVFGGSVAITKTTPAINVSRGDLVPYEITFRNQFECSTHGPQPARLVPRRLPLHQGLSTRGWCPDRTDAQWPSARVGLPGRRCSVQPYGRTPPRRRCGRDRRRVRESGVRHPHGP